MQDIFEDTLIGVIESRMHESIAAGADVTELAALAVDAVVAECVGLLQLRAAQLTDSRTQQVMLACAEMLLSAQFGGFAPAPTRNRA